jgi:hypothetical protein
MGSEGTRDALEHTANTHKDTEEISAELEEGTNPLEEHPLNSGRSRNIESVRSLRVGAGIASMPESGRLLPGYTY